MKRFRCKIVDGCEKAGTKIPVPTQVSNCRWEINTQRWWGGGGVYGEERARAHTHTHHRPHGFSLKHIMGQTIGYR